MQVNSSNPESSKKDSYTELTDLTVLRKYTVIVYNRLIELTLGKYFNDLMETQDKFWDFKVKILKIFDSICIQIIIIRIFLLQEFDES